MLADASEVTDVAPGVRYGEYQMLTADGPLSVHVVAVDPHDPAVHLGTVLASDRLISGGETVGSMALRTQAVAGINGDYFDINHTNQPLNLLVQQGRLIHVPMKRYAFTISTDGTMGFGEYAFAATLQTENGTLQLQGVNDWWAGAKAVLFTPEYGPLPARPGVTLAALQPVTGTPPFGSYRVREVLEGSSPQPPGYYVAIGPDDAVAFGSPTIGSPVVIAQTSDTSLADITTAIGGGPLLVKDGTWYADPDGPNTGEFATHMPASAIGMTKDGSLLLLEVDGRQPSLSIGVLQPQLASLLIAFGAQNAMQVDGGGSSTLVARLPGDTRAVVQNSPSDGTERRVGDGLFVYSDAPDGPPARIYAFPQAIRALPGARVPLRIAVTDAGGHAVTGGMQPRASVSSQTGAIRDGIFIAAPHPSSGAIRITRGDLHANVPVEIVSNIARLAIVPQTPAIAAGGTLDFNAAAFDAQGRAVALPAQLPWSARGGSIAPDGRFRAGRTDAVVALHIGNANVQTAVTVGEHTEAIPLVDTAAFATAPKGGPGSLDRNAGCTGCLTLHYDFTGSERAAYARTTLRLPGRALGLSAEVYGDGSGAVLRAAVNNAINERFLYTIARVTWHGWRRVSLRFPAGLPQPITLKAIYVINRVGPEEPVRSAGAIGVRDVRAIVAGSTP